jgi:dGTP triphosphohydrolase
MLAAEKIIDQLPHWVSPADMGAIIQAACLAHDIGNPPFGHAGEYAIRDWFLLPQQALFNGLISRLLSLPIYASLKAMRKALEF